MKDIFDHVRPSVYLVRPLIEHVERKKGHISIMNLNVQYTNAKTNNVSVATIGPLSDMLRISLRDI